MSRRSRSGFQNTSPAAVLAALSALALVACGDLTEPPKPPAPEVAVTQVVRQDVQLYSEWVGTTEGMVSATIRPKISGYLMEQKYRDGEKVQKGDLLFRIDSRQYKAILDAAKGELAEAQAVLGKAEIDVKRFTPLAERGAVSQQELDDAVQARAAGRARVASAAAAVDSARLDLDWTQINAPITGIADIATAQIGDLVTPVSNLTTISQVDPIKVTFPISELEYLRYTRRSIALEGEGTEREAAILKLILADGSVYGHTGRVVVAGSDISDTTGTILLQGVFPNPHGLLRPGQYAKVRAPQELQKGVLVIPQRAVSQMQGIDQVSKVGPDGVVKLTKVTLGSRYHDQFVVTEGLSEGDVIVVEGLQKIRNGMTVKTKPMPATKAAPAGSEKAKGETAATTGSKAQAGS